MVCGGTRTAQRRGARRDMQYLSLFSGAGGGDLAAQHIKGWTCAGYVEIDDYARQVLAARIADGHLDDAPIYGDVREFVADGTAATYAGRVDVVVAGFPCQPFSEAGDQNSDDDPRNMWPACVDVLCVVRPRLAFLENVAGLLAGSHGYYGRILGDLANLGFNAEWGVLSASAVGAPHRRRRLWIVAYTDRK